MNPYQEWLGRYDLSENSHPNHYDLLGLPLFESDTSRIEQTANQLLEKVRAIRPGMNMPAWSRLISDILAAKDCLCNHHTKKEYDKTLPKPTSGTAGYSNSSRASVAPNYGQVKDYGGAGASSYGGNMATPPGMGGKSASPAGSASPGSCSAPGSYSSTSSYSSAGSYGSSAKPLDSDDGPNLNAIPPSSGPLSGTTTPTSPTAPVPDPVTAAVPQAPAGYPPGYPQPIPGQPMPGYGYPPGYPQPMPGQPMPGYGYPPGYQQPMPGYGYPAGYPQPIPGQPLPGQPLPGQPLPGQPLPGQPLPGQPAGYGYPPGYPQPTPGYPVDPNQPAPSGYSGYPAAAQPIVSAPIPSAQPIAVAPVTPTAPVQPNSPFANQTAAPASGPAVNSLFQDSSPKSSPRRRSFKPAGRPAIYQHALNAACIIGLGIILFLGYKVIQQFNKGINEDIGPDVVADASKNDDLQPFNPGSDDSIKNDSNTVDEAAEGKSGKDKNDDSAKDGSANADDKKTDDAQAEQTKPADGAAEADPKDAPDAANQVTNEIEFSVSNGNAPAEAGADSAKSSAFKNATTEIRAGLAEMDPGYARGKFADADANAQTQTEKDEIARLKALTERIDDYLEWIVSVMSSSNIEEMSIEGEPISIIEMGPKGVSVRARGENRDYGLQQLPPKFVEFITKSAVGKSPVNKALLGSYLAMHPKGNRGRAKQLWLEATKGGEDCTILMPELDVAPVKLIGPQTAGAANNTTGNAKTTAAPDVALSVPNDQQKAEALTKVKLMFASGYASDNPKSKEILSERLLTSTSDAKYSPEEKYVMLEESARLAKEVDRPGIAYSAIDMRGKLYQQDTYKERLDLILNAKPDARGKVSQRDVAESSENLLIEAMQSKKTADAEKLIPILKSAASKSGRVQLIRTALDAERAIKETKKPQTPAVAPKPGAQPAPAPKQPAPK